MMAEQMTSNDHSYLNVRHSIHFVSSLVKLKIDIANLVLSLITASRLLSANDFATLQRDYI